MTRTFPVVLKGRRDLTLLSILYDTGARVQEIIDLKVCGIILDSPAVVILTGKGNKVRRVPLMKNTVALLRIYLSENTLDKPWKNQYAVFTNSQHHKLTKEGVAYIGCNYINGTNRPFDPSINPQTISLIFLIKK